jgi:truncated hemoglobin YjbI
MEKKELIFKVIESFYDKAKRDVLIGYHFRNIQDFETHIPRIALFWEMQLLGSASYKVDPPFDVMAVHTPLMIKKGELGRWMLLFKKTLDEFELGDLKEKWLEKLLFFDGVFNRFFGLKG